MMTVDAERVRRRGRRRPGRRAGAVCRRQRRRRPTAPSTTCPSWSPRYTDAGGLVTQGAGRASTTRSSRSPAAWTSLDAQLHDPAQRAAGRVHRCRSSDAAAATARSTPCPHSAGNTDSSDMSTYGFPGILAVGRVARRPRLPHRRRAVALAARARRHALRRRHPLPAARRARRTSARTLAARAVARVQGAGHRRRAAEHAQRRRRRRDWRSSSTASTTT